MPTHHPLSQSGPELPREAWERLEAILKRFEDAWKRGEQPTIKDYLALIEQDRRALLIELVHEDLEQRLQLGESVRVEAYLGEYPELASDAVVAADLIAAEFVLREKRGETPQLVDYQARFPQLAQMLPQQVGDRRDRALGQPEPPPNRKVESELPTLPPGVRPAEPRRPAATRTDHGACRRDVGGSHAICRLGFLTPTLACLAAGSDCSDRGR
jgi:hypothetical protein